MEFAIRRALLAEITPEEAVYAEVQRRFELIKIPPPTLIVRQGTHLTDSMCQENKQNLIDNQKLYDEVVHQMKLAFEMAMGQTFHRM